MRGFLRYRRCVTARTRAQVYRTQRRSPRIASDFVGTKRVAQPHEPAAVEGDHVETARGLFRRNTAACSQILLRRAHDALLLLPTDARRRAAILPLRACTDFDEYEHAIALAHDEVDLAAPARDVVRDEMQTLSLQKFACARLESRADGFGPVGCGKVVWGCGGWL
jgi:hypothetical protein